MVSSADPPRIMQLTATISEAVAKLNGILASRGIASPSFNEDALIDLPEDAADVHSLILDATLELHDVLLPPMALLIRKTAVRVSS
jgi:hypothetical protein